MTIKEIKQIMIDYRDFYGGDLCKVGDVSGAKTKTELKKIIDDHEAFMEDMLCDAKSHLNELRQKLNLIY